MIDLSNQGEHAVKRLAIYVDYGAGSLFVRIFQIFLKGKRKGTGELVTVLKVHAFCRSLELDQLSAGDHESCLAWLLDYWPYTDFCL